MCSYSAQPREARHKSPGPGGRWEYVLSSEDKLLFLDTETITRDERGFVRVWLRWVFEKPSRQSDGKHNDRVMLRAEADCSEERLRYVRAILYLGDNVVESFDAPTRWGAVVPESLGEGQLEAMRELAW